MNPLRSPYRFAGVALLLAATSTATANAKVVSTVAVAIRPDIHITFDHERFTDIAGGSNVFAPREGRWAPDEGCQSGPSHGETIVRICNDPVESRFGIDSNGSYWKSIKSDRATVGGLLVDPNEPITTEYSIAVTFSMVLNPEISDFSRVIATSAVREDGTFLREDCGVYLQEAPGATTFHPAVYCPDGMFAAGRSVGVASANSEVITLVVTRSDEGILCLYEINKVGVPARLARCADDRMSDPPDSSPHQINDGWIGFFMDNNGEVPISAKIYDIRIWGQTLNLKQLDKAYARPDSPTNLEIRNYSSKTWVFWRHSTTGPTATSFIARAYATKNGRVATSSCKARAKERFCKMPLKPGIYWFTVSAANDYGQSNSQRIEFTVKRGCNRCDT